ncbi:multifunctional CCA tRNA nucleotidyl transferase/2'3'-cyclic phosphodiesterase/2'nucleotidase/phosphatase [Marinibactrum halimedae]|uniref:CCA-adding enzyme n=1 Tax=Marinibactrum halimedae TaxID=1444977 RepID=A0AA37T2G0_9GAMM|nr:multifunctional CCA tRNA nucleotidyl transferase/2'3'-cyclic phosphodiesterase/2'nucleotidase/phosphatase [Marinibactrum halimedae]MCD9459549.1 multifunctional CCA tRNA nucleotidyl transferase/2'3'-cyclic phosphodiesterase/2'nucleotidase/phosphatase [Marinibactrum halimedae]GLS25634.1 hypothetical protein GCM10007877_13480 [Marinibactrum halimedae]
MDVYLVGGAVRDKLLGFPFHEKDWVIVGATPSTLIEQGYTPVGKDFPVFLHPTTKEEYALARTERKTAPGYTGFEFNTSKDVTLEEDLLRRDLTINAIAQKSDGSIIDPYGGQHDLEKKILRHVSPAFAEDPVRILRVARFAARYHHLGFHVHEDTLTLMKSMVAHGEAQYLVKERVWKEFERALKEKNAHIFLEVLRGCGALVSVCPTLSKNIQLGAPCIHYLKEISSLSIDGADQLHPHEYTNAIWGDQSSLLSVSVLRFTITLLALASLKNNDTESLIDNANKICQELLVPKHYNILIIDALTHTKLLSISEITGNDSAWLFDTFKRLDGFRRPNKVIDLLQIKEAYQHICQNFLSTGAKRISYALKSSCEVSASFLIQQGFSGKALGSAIEAQRIKIIKQCLDNSL